MTKSKGLERALAFQLGRLFQVTKNSSAHVARGSQCCHAPQELKLEVRFVAEGPLHSAHLRQARERPPTSDRCHDQLIVILYDNVRN